MKINESNKQRIHDVLITDLQRRIFKQYNARKDEFNITDDDYDSINVFTLEGTMNYLFKLLR